MVGDLLYATIFSYLTLNDVQDQTQSKVAGVVNYRMPSYGIFSTNLQTSYWFGMPRDVSFAGLAMDVDHLAMQVTAKDNGKEKRVGFMKATGARASAMEHLVPEQMFSTEDAPAQGISAVKALALASAEGQRIWTIDRNNLEAALAAINLDVDIETEIRNAVWAGKVATTHERPVTYVGNNVGYLLLDPHTGAGAYKISGGSNGGLIAIFAGALLIVLGMFILTNPAVLALLPFLLGPIMVTGIVSFLSGLLVHLTTGGAFDVRIFSLTRLLTALLLVSIFSVSGGLALPFLLMLLPVIFLIPSDSQQD